ncbi:AAA family ATPase [Microbacterium immunditiarum]|uniref:Nuclease SbcCD subunit C n=1 Tax=Microbacterium immunditiarum TaxID=337480 RepID=A0A7Y9GMB1_9MICO|nr:exonuclease SbcC [Microbacterium immunditiarum]
MRLHRLELEGFGPFRDRQVVDFDAFADDGIFLIAGRTGAGKSSVLDGVCFALYGGVPRYDGAEKRLRSDYCGPDDPTEVSVEFSTGGRRWRVTRSPEYERAKRRGTGTTLVSADAQLDELVGGAWIGRASGSRHVALALDDVLGLSQQQFLQVILLAQNRFAEFLLARSDERQKLLRRLFGTRTYEQYQEGLEQRRRDAEAALAAAGDGVELLLGEAERLVAAEGTWEGFGAAGEVLERLAAGAESTDAPPPASAAEGALSPDPGPAASLADRLVDAERSVRAAHSRAEVLGAQQAVAAGAGRDAEAAFAAVKTLHAKQQQLAASRARLAALEQRSASVAADRSRAARAIAAEALRAPLEAVAAADAAAQGAEHALATHHDAWERAGGRAEDDVARLRTLVDELTGQLAVWAAVAEQESELAHLEERLASDQERVVALERDVAEIEQRRKPVPERLKAIDNELRDALADAGRVDDLRTRLASIGERLAAAHEAQRLEKQLRTADEEHLAAAGRHESAQSAVTALLRRRLASHAAELAMALVDGEPCAVCGSTEHPSPAMSSDAPVTDDEVADVEARRDRAAKDEAAAAEAAKSARDAHSSALARAGGESAASLAEAKATAQLAVAAATEAQSRCERLTAERASLVELDAAAGREMDQATAALAELRMEIAGATADAKTLRAAVTGARGDFGSVAARIAATTKRRGLALALMDALVEHAGAEAALARARSDLETRVAASEFADEAEAEAALLDSATRTALSERVRSHDIALMTETERVRDLEAELGDEADAAPDLDGAGSARDRALAEERAAVEAAARAAQTARRLDDLVHRAVEAQDGVAELAAECEAVSRLANTVAGRPPNTRRMTLESFVLAAELEEIVEAANLRLGEMSSGRYRLQHSDARAARNVASGLGLEIIDAHTGQARPAQSLSGGETFLASLALALGLAEVVTARAGGVRLDTLFIDEGFGSLDEATLDLAMRTLDELRQGGRTVGLISHVAAMKEQLPAQLVVEATAQGPSLVRHETVSATV